MLNQKEALILLKKYSFKTPKTVLFKTHHLEDIDIKFPVALKVDSQDVVHKSDLGLVFLNIRNLDELNRHLKTSHTILKMHDVKEFNFVVQEMVKGQEIIIGMKRDDIFGPVILFGLGGVFVEVLKDVSMRIAPISRKDCLEMINEIKGKKLLEGFRNIKKINKEVLVDALMNLSKLARREKNIREIDFNPIMINDKEAIVVDARFIC
jgi:acetyl-CoA synthetase (ADP-forming)